MNRILKIFRTPQELAEAFAIVIVNIINEAWKNKNPLTIALSGGSTPKLLFTVLAKKYSKSVDWNHVHLFWSDERCIPPVDPESNYGMTRKILLDKIEIPEKNIHRIKGEEDPESEASRYSEEIIANTRSVNNIPLFDLIILGIGEDGHSASIFPGNLKLLSSKKICEVAAHPVSGQRRITITGKVINNADKIFFLVTGKSKAHVIEQIFKKEAISENFPATYFITQRGEATWFLDKKAAELIDTTSNC